MFQGTGSDVGKSLMVAGLARVFTDRGLKVRPFKPQNMSNNAAVTADGGEIGRAQALQARAARVPASVHTNPVLLKPQSEVGAQIVVQGRVHGTAKAAAYQRLKPDLMPFVLDSYDQLGRDADLVLVEGAGSASEVNLRPNDIANMGFSRAADVPVILVGDIDRGGVIASLVGTKTVIDPSDPRSSSAFSSTNSAGSHTVRRRHGDHRRHDRMAAARPGAVLSGRPAVAGEDVLALDAARAAKPNPLIKIAVPILPHVANFDDLDPLDAEPGVDLVRVRPGHALPGDADLVRAARRDSGSDIADLAASLVRRRFRFDITAQARRRSEEALHGPVRRPSVVRAPRSTIGGGLERRPASPWASAC